MKTDIVAWKLKNRSSIAGKRKWTGKYLRVCECWCVCVCVSFSLSLCVCVSVCLCECVCQIFWGRDIPMPKIRWISYSQLFLGVAQDLVIRGRSFGGLWLETRQISPSPIKFFEGSKIWRKMWNHGVLRKWNIVRSLQFCFSIQLCKENSFGNFDRNL